MHQSQSIPDQAQVLADLEAKVGRLERIIQLKDEQIRLLNFRLFGPKSEKLLRSQSPVARGNKGELGTGEGT